MTFASKGDKMAETTVTIGIDLGASKILMLACTAQNEIVYRLRIPTKTSEGQSAVLEQLISHIQQIINDLATKGMRPIAVGVGFPGLVKYDTGFTYSSVMLPGWEGMNLKQYLIHELNVPAIVDNDVNAATYGEWKHGAGAGFKDIICLTVGTGIGGGIILNNALFRGVDGTAGEFGNTTIDYHGPYFHGGNPGALNVLASGKALETRALELIAQGQADQPLLDELQDRPETISVELLAKAAAAGSRTARAIIEDGAKYLGIGIANFVNIFNPELVLIGGGVSQIGEWYLDKVRETVHERAFDIPAQRARILPVSLGQDAGAIGAAALALSAIHE